MRLAATVAVVIGLTWSVQAGAACPSGATVTVGTARDVATIQEALNCLDGATGPTRPGTVLIDAGTYDGFWLLDGTVGSLTAHHSFITVAARESGTVHIRPLDFGQVPINGFGARGNVGATLVGAIREVTLRGLTLDDTHFSVHTQVDDGGRGLETLFIDRCVLHSTATPSQQGQAQDLLVVHAADGVESHITVSNTRGTITFGGLTIATGSATVVSQNNQWHLRSGDSLQKVVYKTTSQFPPARFEVIGDVITSDTLTGAVRVRLLDHFNVKSRTSYPSVFRDLNASVTTGDQISDLAGFFVDTPGFGPRFASFLIADSEIRLAGGPGTTCEGVHTEKKGAQVRVYDSKLLCLGGSPTRWAAHNACSPGACAVYLFGTEIAGDIVGEVFQVNTRPAP